MRAIAVFVCLSISLLIFGYACWIAYRDFNRCHCYMNRSYYLKEDYETISSHEVDGEDTNGKPIKVTLVARRCRTCGRIFTREARS